MIDSEIGIDDVPSRVDCTPAEFRVFTGKGSEDRPVRDLKLVTESLNPGDGLFSFKVKDKIFENVDFSTTKISGFDFTRCQFNNCLFIETHFIECEFHHCTFRKSILWRSKFSRTYIDPAVFEKLYSRENQSNYGVGLFHQMLLNASESRQPEFEATAQYNFYKWKRYQTHYEFREISRLNNNLSKARKFCSKLHKIWLISINWLDQHLLGYGIRLMTFLRTSLLGALFLTSWNYYWWGQYAINEPSGWVNSLYFTIVTVLTVGFGDIVPASCIGRTLIVFEIIAGVSWVGLLTGMLVRKVIK